MTQPAPQYLFDPADKPSLPLHTVPLVEASTADLSTIGYLVSDPAEVEIEIVRWPAQGWRPVDPDTGDQGGVAEGIFHGCWEGDVLRGRNEAVDGDYVLGWSRDPHAPAGGRRDQVLLWHLNYHPDGGQLFFPLEDRPYVVPVAPAGDDIRPETVLALWCEGDKGLYIHPGVWHEGIFPTSDRQRFLDRQGRVHARVSCDLAREFGVYLRVPLRRDALTAGD